MARRYRIVLPGFPHHVTQRGNHRGDIFQEDSDRSYYLDHLAEYMRKYGVRLYSYCLMTNHVHLIPVPESRDSLSQLFHDLHGRYAQYFNRKYGQVGHLWQDRFFSCVLDETHLWNAVRYVERNPVRAEMVEKAEDYAWSSAQAHCGIREDHLLDKEFPPEGLITDWSAWLKQGISARDLEEIRTATSKGTPYATKAFIRGMERLLGISILPTRKEPID